MSNVENLLRNEKLFDVAWDGARLRDTFSQILKIFNSHDDAIKQIQDKFANYATKEEFDKLSDECGNMGEELKTFKSETNNAIKTETSKLAEEIEKNKEMISSVGLELLAETNRVIGEETQEIKENIEKIKDENTERSGKIAALEAEVRILKKSMEKAYLEMSIHKQETKQKLDSKESEANKSMTNFNDTPLDLSYSDEIPNIIGRLEAAEMQIDKIPGIETKVTELTLNLPMTIKLLEKKVEALNSSMNSAETSKVFVSTPLTKRDSAISGYANHVSSSYVRVPKQEKVVKDAPKLEDIHEGSTKTDDKAKEEAPVIDTTSEKQLNESIQKLSSKLSRENSVCKSTKVVESENGEDLDTRILQVFENKIYTTEMQSSMRTVSEIEALKSALQQHHNVINKLQIQQEAIKSNAESIVANLATVNTTHLEKISQLAQYHITLKRDIEEAKKLTTDQVRGLKKRVGMINDRVNEVKEAVNNKLSQQTVVQQKAEEEPKTSAHQMNPLAVLPPLPPVENNMDQEFEAEEEEEEEEEEHKEEEEKESAEPKKKISAIPSRTHYKETAAHKKLVDLSFSHHVEDLPPVPDFIPYNYHVLTPGTATSPQIIEEEPERPDSELSDYDQNEQLSSKAVADSSSITAMSSTRSVKQPSSRFRPIAPERFVMRYSVPTGLARPMTSGEQEDIPMITDEQIETRVRKFTAIAFKTYNERIMSKVEEKVTEMKAINDKVMSALDRKIDREFVERIFDKFREMLNAFKEQMDNMQASFLNWVTRDELEIVLQQFNDMLNDCDNTAVSTSKYTCLLCGRPKQRVAGMINDRSMQRSLKQTINSKATTKKPKTILPPVLSDKVSVMSI